MRKAVRRRSRLLKPAALGSLEGLSSTPSLLPVGFLPGGAGGRALDRRTRSRSRNFWLQRQQTDAAVRPGGCWFASRWVQTWRRAGSLRVGEGSLCCLQQAL